MRGGGLLVTQTPPLPNPSSHPTILYPPKKPKKTTGKTIDGWIPGWFRDDGAITKRPFYSRLVPQSLGFSQRLHQTTSDTTSQVLPAVTNDFLFHLVVVLLVVGSLLIREVEETRDEGR